MAWEREAEEIIAQHERAVAAKTLREAAGDIYLPSDGPVAYVDIDYAEQLANQYLRNRADEIEEGSNEEWHQAHISSVGRRDHRN